MNEAWHKQALDTYLEDIHAHPFEGKRKPEPLKWDLRGYWSRRITDSYRLVYAVKGDLPTVHLVTDHHGRRNWSSRDHCLPSCQGPSVRAPLWGRETLAWQRIQALRLIAGSPQSALRCLKILTAPRLQGAYHIHVLEARTCAGST
jgi:Txe/YoeB family toxin of toxin-antitoxin system